MPVHQIIDVFQQVNGSLYSKIDLQHLKVGVNFVSRYNRQWRTSMRWFALVNLLCRKKEHSLKFSLINSHGEGYFCVWLKRDTNRTELSFAWGGGRGGAQTVLAVAATTCLWTIYQATFDATVFDESKDEPVGGKCWNFKKEDQETTMWTF